MWWRRLLLALAVTTISSAEEEHFLDVKQIVKDRPDMPALIAPEIDVSLLYKGTRRSGTIEAVAKLPSITQNDTDAAENEKNQEEFYRLFQLPADIMTKLAADAGYIDNPATTTNAPWIVRRKIHKSSEEDEESFAQADSEEEEPKRKKKHRKNKDPTLISIRELLKPTTSPTPIAPIPAAPSPNSPSGAAGNAISLPVVQSATGLSHSNVRPQYVYQPIVQPDGKTYYQQVLLVPGNVVADSAMDGIRSTTSEKSAFVQERAFQPKTIKVRMRRVDRPACSADAYHAARSIRRDRSIESVLQADYSVNAPTFPPQIDVFRRHPSSQPSSSAIAGEQAQRSSVYPLRYVKPSVTSTLQQAPPARQIQLPQSDPIAVTSPRHYTTDDERRFTVPRETLYTTRLPSFDEQRSSARIFREEASIPAKQTMKTTQESPLRIQTIDSHVEHASSSETNTIRYLKKDDELRMALERHRLEPESYMRKRKMKKVKKIKKPVKKYISEDDEEDEETSSMQSTSKQLMSDSIRRMPSSQYLKRVPLLTPIGLRKQRVHASKTWKRRRYEPMEDEVSKGLEDFEGKKAAEDEVTEPPRKRRKIRKSGKSKKVRSMTNEEVREMWSDKSRERSAEQSQEDSEQLGSEMEITTPSPLRRKTIRLYRVHGVLSNNLDSDVEQNEATRKPRSRTRKIKKIRKSRKAKSYFSSQSRSSHPSSSSSKSFPLRQHCLNIRTFARQFGTTDIDEFTQEHCAFIENYYPELTCEKRDEYVAECQKYY